MYTSTIYIIVVFTYLGGQLEELLVHRLPQQGVERGGRGQAVEAGVRPAVSEWMNE